MAEQKGDIFEAKKISGISKGKSYAAIVREKKGENSRMSQRKEEEANPTRKESEESAIETTRTQTKKH